jgi:hypothetical protein
MDMNTRIKNAALVVVASLLLFPSCSSTKSIDIWRNSTFEGRYAGNILVVSVNYPFDKRQLEDSFVSRFREYGAQAVSFSASSPEGNFTVERGRAEAKRLKSDAVLTIRLISVKEKEDWVRFAPTPEVPAELYMESMQQSPPFAYSFEVEDVVVESSLYDTASGKLVWRLHSETIKRGSPGKEYIMSGRLAASMSAVVVKGLRDSKLIQ